MHVLGWGDEGTTVILISAASEVPIDVEPRTKRNIVNRRVDQTVAVAILTTPDFEANDVDPRSVAFAGATTVESVSEDVDRDGDSDLLLQFNVQEVVEQNQYSPDAKMTGVATLLRILTLAGPIPPSVALSDNLKDHAVAVECAEYTQSTVDVAGRFIQVAGILSAVFVQLCVFTVHAVDPRDMHSQVSQDCHADKMVVVGGRLRDELEPCELLEVLREDRFCTVVQRLDHHVVEQCTRVCPGCSQLGVFRIEPSSPHSKAHLGDP